MRRLTGVLTFCSVAAACTHSRPVPEYLGAECAGAGGVVPARTGPPVVVMSASGASPGAIVGNVAQAGSEQPLEGARIALSTAPAVAAITDSLGRFAISRVPPGRYAIAVRRIGFNTTRDSITVPADDALRLAVRLETVPFDGGCGGFGRVLVRKPWWKVW